MSDINQTEQLKTLEATPEQTGDTIDTSGAVTSVEEGANAAKSWISDLWNDITGGEDNISEAEGLSHEEISENLGHAIAQVDEAREDMLEAIAEKISQEIDNSEELNGYIEAGNLEGLQAALKYVQSVLDKYGDAELESEVLTAYQETDSYEKLNDLKDKVTNDIVDKLCVFVENGEINKVEKYLASLNLRQDIYNKVNQAFGKTKVFQEYIANAKEKMRT